MTTKTERNKERTNHRDSIWLVEAASDCFRVRCREDQSKYYEVREGIDGRLMCNCPEFMESYLERKVYLCEHMIAVENFIKNSDWASSEPPGNHTACLRLPSQENSSSGNETANATNLIDVYFLKKLELLRQQVDPRLIKQREGWKDDDGKSHYIDYIEWHTVADILDEKAPNWSHTIREIRQVGNFVVISVSITIDGVTREGIGTGLVDSEIGIKKAEHEALKRAALKFGIARYLYKKETRDNNEESPQFSIAPLARSSNELLTSKQMGMILALGQGLGIDVEQECQSLFGCRLDAISKRAASAFINYLQDFQKKQASNQKLQQAV